MEPPVEDQDAKLGSLEADQSDDLLMLIGRSLDIVDDGFDEKLWVIGAGEDL